MTSTSEGTSTAFYSLELQPFHVRPCSLKTISKSIVRPILHSTWCDILWRGTWGGSIHHRNYPGLKFPNFWLIDWKDVPTLNIRPPSIFLFSLRWVILLSKLQLQTQKIQRKKRKKKDLWYFQLYRQSAFHSNQIIVVPVALALIKFYSCFCSNTDSRFSIYWDAYSGKHTCISIHTMSRALVSSPILERVKQPSVLEYRQPWGKKTRTSKIENKGPSLSVPFPRIASCQ